MHLLYSNEVIFCICSVLLNFGILLFSLARILPHTFLITFASYCGTYAIANPYCTGKRSTTTVNDFIEFKCENYVGRFDVGPCRKCFHPLGGAPRLRHQIVEKGSFSSARGCKPQTVANTPPASKPVSAMIPRPRGSSRPTDRPTNLRTQMSVNSTKGSGPLALLVWQLLHFYGEKLWNNPTGMASPLIWLRV